MTDHQSSPDIELLPCPFCGGTDIQIGTCYVEGIVGVADAVRCAACGVRGLKSAWNTRAPARSSAGTAASAYSEAMIEAGAQALIDDAWHPSIPIADINPSAQRKYRKLAEIVLDAAKLHALSQKASNPETVTVPRAAIEWLFGAAPDHEGLWFGESVEQTKMKYGFRSRFRKMCEALGYPISSTQFCTHGVKAGNTCVDCLGAAAFTRPQGNTP